MIRVGDITHEYAVLERTGLRSGETYSGPLVLMEATTSTPVDEHWQLTLEADGAVVITREVSE